MRHTSTKGALFDGPKAAAGLPHITSFRDVAMIPAAPVAAEAIVAG
jgi:hypothetical protein